MITSVNTLRNFKWCGITALLAFTIPTQAQQLYSDSAVAAMTEEKLCMILPDSASVAVQTNSMPAGPYQGIVTEFSIIDQGWIPQCGECITYNFSRLINISSLFVTPSWSSGVCVYEPAVFVAPAPCITECEVGVTASSPIHADLSCLPSIAKAGYHVSALVHETESEMS
jgi:hypothetical protein